MPYVPPNRLAQATSPYLLQHAHQPVDWFPWGQEALTKARVEDKPIFLSIGYSACHWCHVMAHESFEDPEVARLLNDHFVSVKVDREERPDLDDLYMEAVQAIGGRGGWPMSVWLLPDLKPFFGGTYFPKESRQGMPGFRPLLHRIVELWANQRPDLERDAAHLAQGLARQASGLSGHVPLTAEIFEEALGQLRRDFDPEWGGFGPAPKFPAHLATELILRRGTEEDLAMARRTLDAMAEGGMRDHLGGGFARYSVDRQWLVPHFEKMLYDNAQLAGSYLSAFQALGEPRYARIARETLDYILADLQDPSGGFHSSEDADSEGEEGRYYVFRPQEVAAILDPQEADLFCQAFGITESGNFDAGASVLHRFIPTEELAERQGLSIEQVESRLDRLRARVLAHRRTRVRPGKDDKVVAAWNGLALSALARGFGILGERVYRTAAERCARFIESELWKEGVLWRVYRRGRVQIPGFLEDYAAVARGLTDLYEATFQVRWLRLAETLSEAMLQRFEDEREGGFYFTEDGQPDLLHRRKAGWDGAIPAGVTLATETLFRLARHLEREDFRIAAERALQGASLSLARAPRAFLGLLSVLDDFLSEPVELVVAGDPEDPRTAQLLAPARSTYLPGLVVSLASADPSLPLHRGRTAMEGLPAAYLCRSRSCFPPITSPDELAARLSEVFNGRNRPLDERVFST